MSRDKPVHRDTRLCAIAHRLDLTGLLVPDAVCQGPHPRDADVEDLFTHPQRTGVMLHHSIDEAQVIGAACGAHAMGMVLMVAEMGGCSLFCFFRCWVTHPMAVMPMVMVHLGQCDLRSQCRDRSQG